MTKTLGPSDLCSCGTPKDVPHCCKPLPTLYGYGTPELLDALEQAWGIIANASGSDWTQESDDWQKAARVFRKRYFTILEFADHGPAAPDSTTASQRVRDQQRAGWLLTCASCGMKSHIAAERIAAAYDAHGVGVGFLCPTPFGGCGARLEPPETIVVGHVQDSVSIRRAIAAAPDVPAEEPAALDAGVEALRQKADRCREAGEWSDAKSWNAKADRLSSLIQRAHDAEARATEAAPLNAQQVTEWMALLDGLTFDGQIGTPFTEGELAQLEKLRAALSFAARGAELAEEVRMLRESFKADVLVRQREQLRDAEQRIAALQTERDEAGEKYATLALAVNDSTNECLPGCSKFGHEGDCPACDTARWLSDQQKTITALQNRLARLTSERSALRGKIEALPRHALNLDAKTLDDSASHIVPNGAYVMLDAVLQAIKEHL